MFLEDYAHKLIPKKTAQQDDQKSDKWNHPKHGLVGSHSRSILTGEIDSNSSWGIGKTQIANFPANV